MIFETREKYQIIEIKLLSNKHDFSYNHFLVNSKNQVISFISEKVFNTLPLVITLFKIKNKEESLLWKYFDDNFYRNGDATYRNNAIITTVNRSGLQIKRHVQGNRSW